MKYKIKKIWYSKQKGVEIIAKFEYQKQTLSIYFEKKLNALEFEEIKSRMYSILNFYDIKEVNVYMKFEYSFVNQLKEEYKNNYQGVFQVIKWLLFLYISICFIHKIW